MKVAVVGCSAIAQIEHIPNVVEHPDLELHALLDPDDRRLHTLGDRYDVEHRFNDVESMLAAGGVDLDAAVVCTPMHTHADVALPLLDAELHVLLEKPISMTVDDADELVAAADASAGTAMIAYMKRYSRAYERMREAVADLSAVDLITAYDTDGDYARIVEEAYDLLDDDLPESFVEASADERRRQTMAAIDADDPDLAATYDFHLEHVCHDVNALRGLFGGVERIQHVDFFADGRYGTAALEYERGRRCVLESGVGDRKWFDQYIRVDAPEGMVALEFANPFVRDDVPRLRIKRGEAEVRETVETPTCRGSFKRELDHFVACIRGDAAVRTPFAEARDDLALIVDLFRAYQGKSLAGGS